jgi:DNA-binding transcriptional ArsR family regulator
MPASLQEVMVITVALDAAALGRARFAISGLYESHALLQLVARLRRTRTAAPGSRGNWAQRAAAVLDRPDLSLLSSLVAPGYLPDFLTPEPEQFEPAVEDELQAVRDTPGFRVRAEFAAMQTGRPKAGLVGRPVPPIVREALAAGEAALATRVADELGRFFDLTLRLDWPKVRDRLRRDVDARATVLAREGPGAMLNRLHPYLEWDGDRGQLQIAGPYDVAVTWASSLVLVPSTLAATMGYCIDPCAEPKRSPVLFYPVPAPAPRAEAVATRRIPRPTRATDPKALGATRLSLLADLADFTTTADLAVRHGITVSTAGYHLRSLCQARLVDRARIGGRVLYRRNRSAEPLLAHLAGRS